MSHWTSRFTFHLLFQFLGSIVLRGWEPRYNAIVALVSATTIMLLLEMLDRKRVKP